MVKTYKSFSNFDVFAIAKELDLILRDSTILNIYEVEDLLILKINTKIQGKKNLIIKKDARINLTDYDYPIPKYPSQYIMSLRKFLKNRQILSISQYNFDRIVIIELSNIEGESWKLIIELFNKGNYILLNENGIIRIARKYQKLKDRTILANKEYGFPKSRGKDFLSINQEEFKDLIKLDTDVELVRFIARNINIAGFYSEELCYRARIRKDIIGANLNEEELNKLFDSFKKLRNQLLFGKFKPHIILSDDEAEIAVIPFELEMFKDFNKKDFKSFNNAVDEFYSKLDSEKIKAPYDLKIQEQIKAQEKILKNQEEYLEELKNKKKKYYVHGDFIYANFNALNKLISVIQNAKQKKYNLYEINDKLHNAKLEDLEGTEFFNRIIPTTKVLIININEDEVYLDLSKSIGENANLIYSKGKKADKKINGTIPAIEKTNNKIKKLKLEREKMEAKVDFLIKKPKKKWFEKFRWFQSSDKFLVIGGRDASSNEVIFRKHIDSNDLVLHTTFPGSPLTIIKNPENDIIPENTIKEAADFVASYSRAWKENWGVVDVFYVSAQQVSKSPPSGEFLPKGSFMISGKKNFIKNAMTDLSIGFNLKEIGSDSKDDIIIQYPRLICGPTRVIEKQAKNIIRIIPSKTGLTKGKLAKEIKSRFLKNSEKEIKKWINLLSIDDIILHLPSGSSVIKSKIRA
jgi:predicted ribosome quality control (RQC) complex YloA/Tae2 family protein